MKVFISTLIAAALLAIGCGHAKGTADAGMEPVMDSGGSGEDTGPACSANLQNDPDNCGACNNKCSVGSQCVSGKCAGYTVHTPAMPSVAWVDACTQSGAQHVLQNASATNMWAGTALPIPIGFTFNFYGTAFTQAWIGTEGTVGLGGYPQSANGPPGCPLPDTANNYAAVVPFGDRSLQVGTAGVCYATIGTAPNRQFVATWDKASVTADTGSTVSFSAILNENGSTIDFVYQTATAGMMGGAFVDGTAALVGLQAPMASGYTQVAGCGQEIYANVPYSIHIVPAM